MGTDPEALAHSRRFTRWVMSGIRAHLDNPWSILRSIFGFSLNAWPKRSARRPRALRRRASPCGIMRAQFAPTVKLIIFISLNVFGAIGWWLGEPYGIMPAFLLGGVGSTAGVYLGWLAARRWLE